MAVKKTKLVKKKPAPKSKVVKKPKVKKSSVPKKSDSANATTAKVTVKKKHDYLFAIGRRKESVARVRYYKKGEGDIIINGKDFKQYFRIFEHQNKIILPQEVTNTKGIGKITVKVSGGGLKGQADSIKLGISRILLQIDQEFKPILKSNKLLIRDPRVKERKKFGLKKARRAPQWQKR